MATRFCLAVLSTYLQLAHAADSWAPGPEAASDPSQNTDYVFYPDIVRHYELELSATDWAFLIQDPAKEQVTAPTTMF